MKLLTVREAAKVLMLSERTLYQWHWLKKRFPFIKVGGALRISEKDLLQYIEDHKSYR
jgi:excisionase family DNA binding protein